MKITGQVRRDPAPEHARLQPPARPDHGLLAIAAPPQIAAAA